MKKLLMGALLACVTAIPAQAAQLIIEGIFPETIEVAGKPNYNGPAAPPKAFRLEVDLADTLQTVPGDDRYFTGATGIFTFDGITGSLNQLVFGKVEGQYVVGFNTKNAFVWSAQFFIDVDDISNVQYALVTYDGIAGSRFAYRNPTLTTLTIDPLLQAYVPSYQSAVPEPATWAMMIAGFGLAGAAMRKRKPAIQFT